MFYYYTFISQAFDGFHSCTIDIASSCVKTVAGGTYHVYEKMCDPEVSQALFTLFTAGVLCYWRDSDMSRRCVLY